MASGSKCQITGLPKKDCYCWHCNRKRNNAKQRSGDSRSNSGHQDSRKVHDTKGKNNHGRSNW